MASPPTGSPPPGSGPPAALLPLIELKPTIFFVSVPWDNALSTPDNIQKAEKAAHDRLLAQNSVVFLNLTADDHAVSVDSRPRTHKRDGQDVKEVVSTYTLKSAEAVRLFEAAFKSRARRDPSGIQFRTGVAGAKPKKKYLTYAIRNAYDSLSEAALAAALKSKHIELLQFQRLKAAGINFCTAKDIFILVRTSRWVPAEISVEAHSYRLHWIAPAAIETPSYAAAAGAAPPAYKLQARAAISAADGSGPVLPQTTSIPVGGQPGGPGLGSFFERLPVLFSRSPRLLSPPPPPGSAGAQTPAAPAADEPDEIPAEEETEAEEVRDEEEAPGSESESESEVTQDESDHEVAQDESDHEEVDYESDHEEVDYASAEEDPDDNSAIEEEAVRPSSGVVTRLKSRQLPPVPSAGGAPSQRGNTPATSLPKKAPDPPTSGLSSAPNPASTAQRAGGSIMNSQQ